MGKMRKIWTWIWLLNKRLYRKPAFLAILLLIPILVFGYGIAAREESGMVTIVLAQEGEDALAQQVIDELLGSSQLILFRVCDTAAEAQEQVAHGKADAAWVFPEDMAQCVARFAADPDADNAYIRVIQREDKVALMLTREILGGKVLELCAEKVYVNFVRGHLPELEDISEESLLQLYQNTDLSGELFTYEQTDGSSAEQIHEADYLMTPVRGLLAVVIVLCGLAAGMYDIHDSQIGTFAWMSERMRPLAEFGCQMVALVNVSIAALLSLIAVGSAGAIGMELVVLLLYCVCVAAFSMMLRRICGGIRSLGAVMPLLIVLMLLICPVFFDLGALRAAQLLFPPTYYIHAVHNSSYLTYTVAYSAICVVIWFVTGKVLKRA